MVDFLSSNMFLIGSGLVLVFAGILLISLGLLSSEEESIVHESYDQEGVEDMTFIIGESQLLKPKSEQQSSDEGSLLVEVIQKLPFDEQKEKVREKLEGYYLSIVGEEVSRGNIVVLNNGEIVSKQVEDELTVHTIKKAGEESEYDFYAGTHDNGYLVGVSLEGPDFEYEILNQLDDRIRDLEVADIDGDGSNEILATTHFDGITAIFDPEDWSYEVIDEEEYGKDSTYSHEVEAGDVTGDGEKDIVATPSEPNTWDEEQSGVVKLFVKDNGEWREYSSGELDESHIRKIVINPEDNSVIGGVGQRTEPYDRKGSLIKYSFVEESLEEVDEVFSPDTHRNFYPFLVEREGENLVVGLSSNSVAQVVSAEEFEIQYTEEFSRKFEAFYTARTFDYTGDGSDELAIVHDGGLNIYSVTKEEMELIQSVDIYQDFDSSMIWAIEAIKN